MFRAGSRFAQFKMAPSKSMSEHIAVFVLFVGVFGALAWIFRLEDFEWSEPVELDHIGISSARKSSR